MALESLRARAKNKTVVNHMVRVNLSSIPVTMAEVAELIELYPEHPKVENLKKFYEAHKDKFPANFKVFANRELIDGILNDMEIEVDETVKGTEVVKQLKKGKKKKAQKEEKESDDE